MAITNRTPQGTLTPQTVTGHIAQNAGQQSTNSRVQQARFRDPSFGTSSTLANNTPNTDRRRFVVFGDRR